MSTRRFSTSNRRKPYDSRPTSSQRSKTKKYEDTALVLDVIPPEINKRRDKYRDEAIIQVLGTSWFTLLEIIPEDHNQIMLRDEIELSQEGRTKIKTIIGRITYDQLTPVAELQLPISIEDILTRNSHKYISWLNRASPISIRLHSLQLIKGIGPKSLDTILQERKILPFTSYEGFDERTKVSDIKSLLKQRILDEIQNENEKHRLFTRSIYKKL